MNTLYIEPFGGLAGDMLLAALLDLGDPRFTLDDVRALADELVPGEATVTLERVWRGSLSGRLVTVTTPETARPPARHYADLERMLRASSVPVPVREAACAALWTLAVAEGRVHDCAPGEIHFHEVGAVDTLIDVGGAALALERLGVERVLASAPLLGSGTVRCAHGLMPVPAPAVAELMRDLPTRPGGGGERLTPTAAAVLAAWVEGFAPPAEFVARRIGYGAGARDPDEGPPNLCRVQLGEARAGGQAGAAVAWRMDVNLDDMTAEEIGDAVRRLRDAGALEVWTAPLAMKKDRPGTLVSALAREELRAALERVVFEWTTTLGVRWSRVERSECGRRTLEVELGSVRVRVKLRERPLYSGRSATGARDLSPEHDDLVRAAEAAGMTLREARAAVVARALESL